MTESKVRKAVAEAAELSTDESMLENVKQRFTNIIEEARDKSQELFEEAKDRGSELLEDAQDRSEEVYDKTARWVRRHPSQAIGLAVAAGLIVYAIMSRED